jgi:metal-sulfur cluster biosynthetic enzyme
MITKENVMEKLSAVEDPEIAINIVDLGLIYGVEIAGAKVTVKMTLTTPACPLLGHMISEIKSKVGEVGAEDVDVEIVWDPPWTPEKMSERARAMLGVF